MSRGGLKGLSVQVANTLFKNTGVWIEDKKQSEGSYIAHHPDNIQTIRKPKVTECAQTIIDSWFQLK